MGWKAKTGTGTTALLIISLLLSLNYVPTHNTFYCAAEPGSLSECEHGFSSGKGTRCYLEENHSSWDYCGSGWLNVSEYVEESDVTYLDGVYMHDTGLNASLHFIINNETYDLGDYTEYNVKKQNKRISFGDVLNVSDSPQARTILSNFDSAYYNVTVPGGTVFTNNNTDFMKVNHAYTYPLGGFVMDYTYYNFSMVINKIGYLTEYGIVQTGNDTYKVVMILNTTAMLEDLIANGFIVLDFDPTITDESFTTSTAATFNNTEVSNGVIILSNTSLNGTFTRVLDIWNGTTNESIFNLSKTYYLHTLLTCDWKTNNSLTLHFDKDSSTQIDSSGNGNDGTVVNDAHFNSSGYFGGAYQFDGDSDYINIGNPTELQGIDDITLEFWMNADVTSGSIDQIMGKGQDGSNQEFVIEVGRTADKLDWVQGNNVVATSNRTVTAGQWHHIVGMRNGTSGNYDIEFFIDGVPSGKTNTAVNPNGNGNFGIGTSPNAVPFSFDGRLDEVNIYPRALSAAEILEHNNSDSPPRGLNVTNVTKTIRLSNVSQMVQNETGLVLWFNMTNQSGVVVDKSGSGNNGTITGTVNLSGINCYPSGENCLNFNKGVERVFVSDSASLDITGAITLESWIYKDSDFAGGFGVNIILDKINTYGLLGDTATQKIDCWFAVGGWSSKVISTFAPSNNAWHHVACVYNTSHAIVYIDGAKDNIASLSGALAATGQHIFIGGFTVDGFAINGSIDSSRIYNRALSDEEMLRNYEHMNISTFGDSVNVSCEDNESFEGITPFRFIEDVSNLFSSNSSYSPVYEGDSFFWNESIGGVNTLPTVTLNAPSNNSKVRV